MSEAANFSPLQLTSNTLTAQQRSHLVRSTRKLERVLGSTPRLTNVENCPDSMSASQSFHTSQRNNSWMSDESSDSSRMNYSGSQRPESRLSFVSTTSLRSAEISSPTYGEFNATAGLDSEGSRNGKGKNVPPPIRMPPKASLPEDVDDFSASPSTSTFEANQSGPSTMTSSSSGYQQLSDSPTEISFSRESEKAMRRHKIERLRRKLGEEVPVDAVFPPKSKRSHATKDGESVKVISIPAHHRSEHHTVVIKTSTSSSSRSGHGHKHAPRITDPRDLFSIVESAELGTESGEQEGLVGQRRRPAVGSRIGSEEYLAHRRRKMRGNPTIEPVGFFMS